MFRLLERMDVHAGLIARMAKITTGDDLGAALDAGRLSAAGVREAVLSCTGCSHADACRGWIEAREGGRAEPPAFCRNAALLERLAPAG